MFDATKCLRPVHLDQQLLLSQYLLVVFEEKGLQKGVGDDEQIVSCFCQLTGLLLVLGI